MSLPISPLAPQDLVAPASVSGVHFFTGNTGLKYAGRDDLFLAEFAPGTVGVGSFTQNQFVGAPVTWTRAASAAPRALVVNAGNANVANGAAGEACTAEIAAALAADLGCEPAQIWQSSTGVIGELLEPKPLIHAAREARRGSEADVLAAAKACLTTDTFPKTASRTFAVGDQTCTLSGFAKGSGMVQPNMATMLAFAFTDAKIEVGRLKALHQQAVEASLNAITVDSDTSTSDMALTFATGQGAEIGAAEEGAFLSALTALYQDLARLVVRDGEGASKFIEIEVSGAASAAEAKTLAFSVANSPLFKTAIAGEDANWGRILMALGKTDVPFDPAQVRVAMGGIPIVADGARVADYDEAPVAAHLKGQDIQVSIEVGAGEGAFTVWTCDLTHGYISINADYRS